MYQPLSLFLGLRYIRSRQGQGFAKFISASSTLGIALGVAVLIIVLSAMNGFERVLAEKLLSIVPHSELVAVNEPVVDWQDKAEKIAQHPQVEAVAPLIKMTGMAQRKSQLKAIELRGVDANAELNVSNIDEFIIQGSWLAPKSVGQTVHGEQTAQSEQSVLPQVVIGSGIAEKLNVNVGDKIQLLLPKNSAANNNFSRKFTAPKRVNAVVSGIFRFGGVIDDTLAYIDLDKARDIQQYERNEVQGLRLKVSDVFSAPSITKQIAYDFNHYVYIYDWTRTQGHLFNDIQLVRTVMFIVMVLVIAVASFNIVSTLIMVVNDKKGDIAILKTMGASRPLIMVTFVLQGMSNGVLGSVSGGLIGVYIATNLTEIATSIEQILGTKFLSGDVYFIDYLPSVLNLSDVYLTVVVAFIMSILATLYPAWQATKVDPAQVLGQI